MNFPRHEFSDHQLLAHALTHRSAGRRHNERLEFLGDAVLGFVIADLLYHRFPELDEGVLTRGRASLVNRESLAGLARECELGTRLELGQGERKSGGWRRDSILANAMEAVIGAIYLDGGMDACREEIERLFDEKLAAFSPAMAQKDAKTRLQEFLQARGEPLPEYEIVDASGTSPNQTFTVTCGVSLLDAPIAATARSRRLAEQAAAEEALTLLAENEGGS